MTSDRRAWDSESCNSRVVRAWIGREARTNVPIDKPKPMRKGHRHVTPFWTASVAA
jgi:hypothetical protein